jgi:hypothetical protein
MLKTIQTMSTIQLTPKVATVPVFQVQKTVSEALGGLFRQSLFIHCEMNRVDDDEAIIVMTGNGICATLHVQSMESALEMGGGVA